ncbi:Glu-tRNA(Gln) amidotransferase subunit GatD [Solibaculum mannosilyticum]
MQRKVEKSMTKIRIVWTGGTIGSSRKDGVADVDQSRPSQILEQYSEAWCGNVLFEDRRPVNLLSENLHVSDWKAIWKAVVEEGFDGVDGVLVAHGTDTLHYTAAALSFALSGVPVPVMLVGSNLPIDEEGSNGIANFAAAVQYIQKAPMPGVFVAYQNPGESEVQIHLGSRLMPCQPFVHRFNSAVMSFGVVKDGRFYPTQEGRELLDSQIQSQPTKLRFSQVEFSDQVLCIQPYPGIDYSRYDLDNVKAVVHGLYHAGTASVREPSNLSKWVEQCSRRGIPVYLAPMEGGEKMYSSSRTLLDAGAKPIPDMTAHSAAVKVMMACGMFAAPEDWDAFLKEPLAEEFVGRAQ